MSEYQSVIAKIADYYGREAQIVQAIEEMAELTAVLAKTINGGITKDRMDHLCEEIADVEIMLEQVCYLYRCCNAVNNWKINKVNRQLIRIAP